MTMQGERCYICMTPLSGVTICPACNTARGSEPDNSLYLPAGYRLNGRYLVGKVVGVGGFGIVYIAWDENLDIKVAVKEFLPKEYAARSSDHISITPYAGKAKDEFSIGAEKFLEEAKALAKFQEHPGIVMVHESFRANNTAYLIMQFLEGMTLKEYLKSEPQERMPLNIVINIMLPIMDALKEVHKAGFVHRDISPDNIFITRQKQIKLLDFGAARYAIGEHSKSLTSVLKHGYAPVEQYSSKGNQGPWSDVYAVAATIYRCVTGQIPPDSMERIQEETIKSPRQLGIDMQADKEAALMRGLAIKATDRFDNIEYFQQALLTGEMPVKEAPGNSRAADSSKIVSCPKCGAQNELSPDENPAMLSCGRCGQALGSISNALTNPSVSIIKNVLFAKWKWIASAAVLMVIVLFFVFYESPAKQYQRGSKLFKTNKSGGASLIIKSADRGYADAQAKAAELYFVGEGVQENEHLGFKYAEKAAENENAEGFFELGYAYFFGSGVNKDYNNAEYYLKKGADKGSMRASAILGEQYYFGRGIPQNYAEASRYLLPAAKEGYSQAQACLGEMYLVGRGVPMNYNTALEWLKKAADNNNGMAQRLMGAAYAFGWGVQIDMTEARAWLRKAIRNGDEKAKELIGHMPEG